MWEYRTLLRDRRPARQLVVQLTERCNARCPQCGMNVTNSFARATVPLPQAMDIVERAAARGFTALSFTGGEPLLHLSAVTSLARHARDLGIPHVRTGTNGFLFRGHQRPDFEHRVHTIAASLAAAGISTFWISIDSADPRTHERIRGMDGVWEGIRAALPIFHEHGLYPAANVGLTRMVGTTPLDAADPGALREQARAAFRDVFAAIADLGFTMSGLCYPMSLPSEETERLAAYRATSASSIVRFSPAEKAAIYEALLEVIPSVRPALRLFTPRCNLDVLRRENLAAARRQDAPPSDAGTAGPGERTTFTAYPCRGGVDFFFIAAADGLVYPCGYRGDEPLGAVDQIDFDHLGEPFCTACEWECFRDPSELLGPLLDLRSRPSALLGAHRPDPRHLRYWFEDVRYALACDMFDARKPPDYRRLAAFARAAHAPLRPSISIGSPGAAAAAHHVPAAAHHVPAGAHPVPAAAHQVPAAGPADLRKQEARERCATWR